MNFNLMDEYPDVLPWLTSAALVVIVLLIARDMRRGR